MSKTKVQVFGCRNYNQYNFKIGNTDLEMVDHFKYLGVYFSKSCSFIKTKTHLVEQANKALHFLYTRINKLPLPIDLILKLFDNAIAPILTNSCEVWGGFGDCNIIEKTHYQFLRYLTKLRKSTPTYMLMGELGRYPMEIIIKCRMIGFWYKLLTGNTNKLSYRLYHLMFSIPGFQSKWITKIKEILGETGKMHYWCNQSNLPHHPIKNSIRQSLIDQYKQNWHSSLQTSSKGKHYSLFKSEINLEKYFLILNRNQAIQFAKFRTNNNYLPLRQGGGQELKLVKENVNFVIKMILGILFTIYLSVPLSQLSENSISQNTFTIILISLNSNKSCPYQHNNNYKKYLNLSH